MCMWTDSAQNIYAWHKINNFVTVYDVKHLTIYGYFEGNFSRYCCLVRGE